MKQNKKSSENKITSPENLSTIKRLLAVIFKKHPVKLLIVAIFVAISSCIGVVTSFFVKILIDDYITPMLLQDTPDFAPLVSIIITFAMIYALGVAASFFYTRIMVDISEDVLRDFRDGLFEHLQKLPIGYFDTHSHGNIMSHFTNDVQILEQMVTSSIPQVFSSVLTFIAVISAMLYSSVVLSIVAGFSFLLVLLVMNKIGGRSSKYFLRQQESLGKENGYIEEMIDGQKVIKVFNHENNIVDDFDVINDELAKNTTLANMYSLILLPIVFSISNLQYAITAVAGGLLAISGKFGMTVGTIAAFLQLSRAFAGPIRNIAQQMNVIISAIAGARRIFNLLDEEQEDYSGDVCLVRITKDAEGNMAECEERTNFWAWKDQSQTPPTYTELKGDIRFFNVNFSYDKKHDVLHDISLFAKPGQKLAFVGETGAGKTTITNLINRFYEIDSGTITYDGIDTKRIKKADLRRSLGMVLQDTNLFTGSIYYNLSYGRNHIDKQAVKDAAEKVQADNFIELLPEGYDTIISGTTSDLSQGQSQLLSIARTEVYDPPVLVLDEATSSIDSRTEMLVQEGMNRVMKNRTTFVIAHRLSTVRDADAIIVLSQGKIIERGSHDELLALNGVYAKLYTGGLEEAD
ncbi:ATP-binding cassette, subfamily B [Anaerosphaera aminiphila DSM 21120]|uniref:ATP-binding cassette, subfamily B n=1 Tax=Anaerosphaera aminiphila DSM 21120 TaxID=1120995 RepID=A0A1M5SS70_9FIRM|nr:ABC transporter ATP-binding protein [Anaerosphaera aminiphila]SHH41424.1 ATP-binding cassette, subfamily B [Anaerosphaera aminiphila DSM 21120]